MSDTLPLEYNLAELPSSQHRAGLAGLVLMVRWLKNEPDKKGICEITQIDATSAALNIDRDGYKYLFDKVYGYFLKEIKFKDDETAKNVLQPLGGFLPAYDATNEGNDGIWIKLWRDMYFRVIRPDDKPKHHFKSRIEGKENPEEENLWKNLQKPPKSGSQIKHSLLLGAQSTSAEDVPFKDRPRYQLLLHFWPMVIQTYVPVTWKFDRDRNRELMEDTGFAIIVPDIADLENFCDELPDILRSRGGEVVRYRPKESLIDIAAEGGLDFMLKLNQRLALKSYRQIADLLLGVDVIHLQKPPKSRTIKFWGTARVDPVRPMIDEYARVKEMFNNPLFRKQRMLNVLNEKVWFHGYGRLLSKTDSDQTIGNSVFRGDVRRAFEDFRRVNESKGGNIMDASTKETTLKTVESVVYDLVSTYVREKLRNKYQLEWSKVKGTPDEKKFNEMKGKVARESFLAIRSRTDEDFVEYFVSTLCSYSQFSLKGDGFDLVAGALYDEEKRNQVRTLTMLALSANGCSPKSEKGDIQK